MAERHPATDDTQTPAKSATASNETFRGLSDEELAALKERTQELKAEAHAGRDKAAGERDVLAKIAEMCEPDRAMAERLHALIKASAPALTPKPGTGCPPMPTTRARSSASSKAPISTTRGTSTFGFQDAANLEDGTMWPTAFALTELTTAGEARIAALVKKAVS
jgi:hypothetical protein